MADLDVDARGVQCPVPVLRMRRALDQIAIGQTLRVVATDPATVNDIRAFLLSRGDELVEATQASGEYIYIVRRCV